MGPVNSRRKGKRTWRRRSLLRCVGLFATRHVTHSARVQLLALAADEQGVVRRLPAEQGRALLEVAEQALLSWAPQHRQARLPRVAPGLPWGRPDWVTRTA